MPIIQQERGVRTVKGLPPRWGAKAYKELTAARAGAVYGPMPDRYNDLAALLDEVVRAPLPLDCSDAQLTVFAERFANECSTEATALTGHKEAIRKRLEWMVRNRGLTPPQVEDHEQFYRRCIDPQWWRRNLRKVHGRAFEHAAVRLGFVSSRAGLYASHETVKRHMAQQARNRRVMEQTTLENDEGQRATIAELAATSVANKRIRAGELMLRMNGCEQIADELGHVGVFITLTCPSAYHAVLQGSGAVNPKYNGKNAGQGQAYLMGVWKRIRSALSREHIKPYGFRIAEPHHDGCPHWHILVFMPQEDTLKFSMIMRAYALEEDGHEPGAKENRVKLVRIEKGMGTAAGYIAKYVRKNVGDHDLNHHEEESCIGYDLLGDMYIKPHQRVEAWASTWGIRQFQPLGQPPVTVWRELRRIRKEAVESAPTHLRDAWDACQRVSHVDPDTGEVMTTKRADFAEYIRAQGGVNRGRDYLIHLALVERQAEGRYGLAARSVPVGVYSSAEPDRVFDSKRWQWRRVGSASAGRPWSPVNNCTEASAPEAHSRAEECLKAWQTDGLDGWMRADQLPEGDFWTWGGLQNGPAIDVLHISTP